MAAGAHLPARTLARLERLATRPAGLLALFLVALAVYAVRAIGWPLEAGRDFDEYVFAYLQLFDADPVLPWSSLFRTPVAAVGVGAPLDFADGVLAEPLLAVLYAASVVAWSAAAARFGPRVALAVAAALLLYPAYGLLFHEVSSEPLFGAGFALWAYLLVRAADRPSASRFALAGLGIALVALIRPGNAVLLLVTLFPLALAGALRDRLRWTAAFAVAAVVPLAAWTVHNGIRYDEYVLARGGNAVIPFYRAFITDRIVSPENGSASRKLADAVEKHLVTREPYRSYGVTTDEVFESGSFRIHEDLYLLSDEVFGWGSDYSVLRDAGIEAVRAHPGTYTTGVLETVWLQLSESLFRDLPGGVEPGPPRDEQTVTVGGRELPRPTEGQPIPGGQVVWISRPDNAIKQVWTSPTEFTFSFADPSLRPRFEELRARQKEVFAGFPDHTANATVALRLNQLSRWFPRPVLWIALGLVAIAVRRPRGSATLLVLAGAALLVILLNALGLFADRHFALPVTPAFVLLGLAGLLGRRRSYDGSGEQATIRATGAV